MGQKTNPIGLRIALNKDWRSKWYAEKKEFGKLLDEDRKIRELLKKKLEPDTTGAMYGCIASFLNNSEVTKLMRLVPAAESADRGGSHHVVYISCNS
jgi:small subunit ribosomal protein S3